MNCKGELITAAVVATSAVLSFHTIHFVTEVMLISKGIGQPYKNAKMSYSRKLIRAVL